MCKSVQLETIVNCTNGLPQRGRRLSLRDRGYEWVRD